MKRSQRHQPGPGAAAPERPAIPDDEVLRLSYGQIDDYETCPLKYRYVHVLRVPLLTHHAVVYGHAVHEAVRHMFEARLAGRAFSADDLVAAFERPGSPRASCRAPTKSSARPRARPRSGASTRRRQAPWNPTAVEQEFAFDLGRNRVVGRYDLVVEHDGHVTIVDFKTGDVRDEKAAEKRAPESLQLDVYALAYLRTKGRLPDRVELRFLETGLVGRQAPDPGGSGEAEARIRAAADAHPPARLPAPPTFMACGQCPFRDICPHTARGPGRGSLKEDPWDSRRRARSMRGKTVTAKVQLEPTELIFRGALKLQDPAGRGHEPRRKAGGSAHARQGDDSPRPRRGRGEVGAQDPLPDAAGSTSSASSRGCAWRWSVSTTRISARSCGSGPTTSRWASQEGHRRRGRGALRTKDLPRLEALRAAIKKNGAIWVVWTKGRKEFREDDVRADGPTAGLVDVKVMSFSDTLSGLKMVIPVKER